MAGITNGTGVFGMSDWLLNGKTTDTDDSVTNGYDTFCAFMKAQSGDYVLACSPATAAPSAAALAANAVSYVIDVTLQTGDGEVHSWYNGPVLIAIADNDDTGAATISPAAGERNMTNGHLAVTVTMSKAAWTAGKKATLTVSDPATAGTGFNGWVAADATFVATVAE